MKKLAGLETGNNSELIINNHSEKVSRIINELLAYGVIGIEAACIIDLIDVNEVMFFKVNKNKLIDDLYILIKKVNKFESKKLTSGTAESISLLFLSIQASLNQIKQELFAHTGIIDHIESLEETMVTIKKRNNQITHAKERKYVQRGKRLRKELGSRYL